MYQEEQNTIEGRKEPQTTAFRQYLCSATAVIILVNILIFFRTDFTSLMGWENTWMKQGWLSWQAFFHDHEYYRLLTSMFLHSGIDHILNNMLVLFFLGIYLEQTLGTRRFTILYFCSGLLAGCTSMVYNMLQNEYVVAVGASGAIFGVMGGLLTMVLIHPEERAALDFRRLAFGIFLSLYSGLTDQGVDNAAHIGGFLAGILITLLLGRDTNRKGHNAAGTEP